jgi:hypothetical protein
VTEEEGGRGLVIGQTNKRNWKEGDECTGRKREG